MTKNVTIVWGATAPWDDSKTEARSIRIAYLESKFQTGMTWENHTHNGWHIDHIIPISKFDLTDEAQMKKACHYTNLQPLWAGDNFRKHAKILSEVTVNE